MTTMAQPVPPIDEPEAVRRAASSFARWCRRAGVIYQEPSGTSGFEAVDDRPAIVLRNRHGVLAAYDVGASGRLRRIRLPPSAQ